MKEEITIKIRDLSMACDIALDVFQNHPPSVLDATSLVHVIKYYQQSKVDLQNTKYQNKRDLKQIETEVFTCFNEDNGPSIDYFWQQIHANNLPFQRKDLLAKILKRKKIKDHEEYNFVTDVVVAYAQEGRITEEQETMLKKMIGDFEQR